MATRTMYDAINPAAMPANGDLYGGYAGGLWPTFCELATLFPGKLLVSIAVNASEVAAVLDVESGDATPEQAPGWCRWMRSLGIDPTVYCSTALWPQVLHAFQAAGEPLPHWFEARYGNGPDLLPGRVAHQYEDVGPYDVSVVVPAGEWPGVDHNTPTASSAPTEAPGFEIAAATPLQDSTEGAMQTQVITIPTDGQGNGCGIFDGGKNSVYGVGSLPQEIPWAKFVGVTAQSSCPPADGGYWSHTAHATDRGGYVLLSVTGGPVKGQANVVLTTTT